jgi:predicted DsbA family dithiol-disulfide isomerase
MAPAAAAGDAPMRVDFVSDLTCPWCAIGLRELERAIAALAGEIAVELHLQPFELNPDIPPGGEPIADYAWRKAGAGAAELAARQALIRRRGQEVGYAFALRSHVYNSFDAHRLLHWAAPQGRALALKRALLMAYHVRGENPAAPDVLLQAAREVGLDAGRARSVLDSGANAEAVRATTRHWQQRGVASVPTTLIAGRWPIEGAQTAATYGQALRRLRHARFAPAGASIVE